MTTATATIPSFVEECEKFRTYSFVAAGYTFNVLFSKRNGFWTVAREGKGAQLKTWGKTFWRADELLAAYKTARAEFEAIIKDCGR